MLKFIKEEQFVSNINPYATTVGQLLLTSDITEKYYKFILNNNSKRKLNYDIDFGSCNCVLILGNTDDEKTLPPLDYPLTIYGTDNKTYIVIDLRAYVNKDKLENNVYTFNQVLDAIPRLSIDTVYLLLYMGKIMSFLYDGEFSILQQSIVKPFLRASVCYLTVIFNKIIELPPTIKLDFEFISSLYFLFQTTNEELLKLDHNYVISKIQLLSFLHKSMFKDDFVFKVYVMYMQKIQNVLENKNKRLNIVEEVVKDVIEEDFSSRFKLNVISQMTSKDWHSFGKSNTPLIALENLPLMLVMLYAANGNTSFKNCNFSSIINKCKAIIEFKDYNKTFEHIFKFTY